MSRSGLDAAARAADAVRRAGVGNDRIVDLPMRGQDTPTLGRAGRRGGRPAVPVDDLPDGLRPQPAVRVGRLVLLHRAPPRPPKWDRVSGVRPRHPRRQDPGEPASDPPGNRPAGPEPDGEPSPGILRLDPGRHPAGRPDGRQPTERRPQPTAAELAAATWAATRRRIVRGLSELTNPATGTGHRSRLHPPPVGRRTLQRSWPGWPVEPTPGTPARPTHGRGSRPRRGVFARRPPETLRVMSSDEPARHVVQGILASSVSVSGASALKSTPPGPAGLSEITAHCPARLKAGRACDGGSPSRLRRCHRTRPSAHRRSSVDR